MRAAEKVHQFWKYLPDFYNKAAQCDFLQKVFEDFLQEAEWWH